MEWAVREQSDLGLDIITDGEGYRENMYWFYQLRTEGVDAENKKYKHFSTGGSMDNVDLSKTHGTKGFGIECAVVENEIKNQHWDLASKWKRAQDAAKTKAIVKQTITGPHMLSRFSVNNREDLYKNDKELAFAYSACIKDEIEQLQKLGCERIQLDEPVLTEAPQECVWAADVINDIIDSFPTLHFSLHICVGRAYDIVHKIGRASCRERV